MPGLDQAVFFNLLRFSLRVDFPMIADRRIGIVQTKNRSPETGKRILRLTPPEEWIVQEVPGLRIVPAELLGTGRGAASYSHRRGVPRPGGKQTEHRPHGRACGYFKSLPRKQKAQP